MSAKSSHICTLDEDGYCDECGWTYPELAVPEEAR